jgi:4-amino-4-deoxy-L-arabinose transferase-like glycosyltransferase
LPSWSWIAIAFGLLIFFNGASLGLTDDEAYYWVLSRHPALGYAYHPPMVAWLVAVSEFFARMTGGMGLSREAWVRMPAALSITGVLTLALSWIAEVSGDASPKASTTPHVGRSALFLLSFAGFFSLSWMIVPDTSLFVGWTLAFVSAWAICFRREVSGLTYSALGVGVALAILSKYSGVLAAFSAGLVLLLRAPKERRLTAAGTVMVAVVIASIPILLWNSSHEWASILYQLEERHEGAHLSIARYARFWGVELIAAGPAYVLGLYWLLSKRIERVFDYALFWALPGALVFCVQPLFSDFKPHWAFIVWWPVGLALAHQIARSSQAPLWSRLQTIYGLLLGTVVLVACQAPVLAKWVSDPKMDVTNDLYGWNGLPDALEQRGLGPIGKYPVIGSRYQTASQAAFALGTAAQVTLMPRDLKARDEWPMLAEVEDYRLQDRKLLGPVIFVADNRYSDGPPFSRCTRFDRDVVKRGNAVAKWIDIWRCDP